MNECEDTPASPPDTWEWEDADLSLDLTSYLRIFLCRLGYPQLAAQIHDSLDCRRVLRYQAIVQASVRDSARMIPVNSVLNIEYIRI